MNLQVVTGKQLQRMVGHWVWVLMAARPGRAILSSVYKFIDLEKPRPVWASVRDELYALGCLAPRFKTALATPWHLEVFATDASDAGFGVVSCMAETSELRKEYRIGIEFTDWPTRPKPKPQLGPLRPDARWPPIDLVKGTCVGDCSYDKPRPFKKTVRGLYHK